VYVKCFRTYFIVGKQKCKYQWEINEEKNAFVTNVVKYYI